MIQDIEPRKLDNQYKKDRGPSEKSMIMFVTGRRVLAKITDGQIEFPKACECGINSLKTTYLFAIDDDDFFFVDVDTDDENEKESVNAAVRKLTESGYGFITSRDFRVSNPKWLCHAGLVAVHAGSWYSAHRYCGKCGKRCIHDENERMMKCPSCGKTYFPQICPAVIVAVTDKDRLLMSKYEGREYTNYALIAGFNEIGETIEQTVHREVMEEVGVKVKNLRYYKSQPWAMTDTLLMGFYCELDGSDGLTVDKNELSMAQWFDRDKIPVRDDNTSLTREMVERFRLGKENEPVK